MPVNVLLISPILVCRLHLMSSINMHVFSYGLSLGYYQTKHSMSATLITCIRSVQSLVWVGWGGGWSLVSGVCLPTCLVSHGYYHQFPPHPVHRVLWSRLSGPHFIGHAALVLSRDIFIPPLGACRAIFPPKTIPQSQDMFLSPRWYNGWPFSLWATTCHSFTPNKLLSHIWGTQLWGWDHI